MVKNVVVFIVIGFFAFSLSGCATARKQKELEIQGLRNQISVLETQLQSKDEEINALRETIKAEEEKKVKIVIGEAKSRPSAKQIQIALKNAGYEPGAIDGKMGKQTRDAIKAFQRANNLSADGKVGRKTWGLLKVHLYKKEKIK
ncbi:MAG: peptidoglycan-binding protein [Candidatus Omnitrophica bacterium]|nr:peptidoglycan-binding protein [Candidatus Omnitrophota bacterium]MDD5237627.1 peptidoglycan-binding protein [Candidatus Omnitrophota bacterium]